MASLACSTASSTVRPWLKQPGSAGTSTEWPSPSRTTTMEKVRGFVATMATILQKGGQFVCGEAGLLGNAAKQPRADHLSPMDRHGHPTGPIRMLQGDVAALLIPARAHEGP